MRSTKFEFVVNLYTAKPFGIDVPAGAFAMLRPWYLLTWLIRRGLPRGNTRR
jgi:hypothetical protein